MKMSREVIFVSGLLVKVWVLDLFGEVEQLERLNKNGLRTGDSAVQ